MQTLTKDELSVLQTQIRAVLTDDLWLPILNTLAITGVADNLQLQRATGLGRDKLRRTLDKLEFAEKGFPPILNVLERTLTRPGLRGRSPAVYRLAESGATLLNAERADSGEARFNACGLDDDDKIAHALAMLDIHLAAQQAGLAVCTDHVLRYGEEAGDLIRPDCLITLPDGVQAIFEAEQMLTADLVRRAVVSLSNKAAFFASSDGKSVSNSVRVLVNLPRGKYWERTLKFWWQACEIVRSRLEAPLPFQLLAMPLSEFLEDPDWGSQPDLLRWTDIPNMQPPATAADAGENTKSLASELQQIVSQLPRFSSREDLLILAAMHHNLLEIGAVPLGEFPASSPEFFALCALIYEASHNELVDVRQKASIPRSSLYLLNQYLTMHPDLKAALDYAIRHNAPTIRWNQSMSMHRMQVIVNCFLEYHGWRCDGLLRAYPTTPDYQSHKPHTFSVGVDILDPELTIHDDEPILPTQQEISRLERAVAWVLTALFAYAPYLGLRKTPFW